MLRRIVQKNNPGPSQKLPMTTLREFMNARRVTDSTWNLTGMGKDAGKYYVAPADYQEFLAIFSKEVHNNRIASSLLERHGTYSPLLIDLDFRYSPDLKERAYDKAHVVKFLKMYAEGFFHFFDYETPLRFFAMLRPEIVEEKGVVKDGLHILCGDVTLEYSVLHTLRAYALEKNVLAPFADRINTDKDCFDEAVIQRNNWFLYGASKPNHEAYIADYCFLAHPDGRIEEAEWIETDEELVQLFSLQYGRSEKTGLKLREDCEDEWKQWESIAMGDTPDPKPTTAKTDLEKQSVCTSVSNDICRILKLNGYDWKVDECDEGFKLSHNTKDCLVAIGTAHSALGHSCVFVQKNHATLSCFSHNSKKLPRNKADALWRLLNNEEDDCESAYIKMKEVFERTNFRVLYPPGYMTKIDDCWVHYTRQQLMDVNSGFFMDDAKKERFIDWWLKDDRIRTYSRTGYFVDPTECPGTVFNTFTGFAAAHLPERGGDIQPILDHLEIICGKSHDALEFVLDWMASCIQRPGRLTHICIVLIGPHGAGKDLIFDWFGTQVLGMDAYFKTVRPHIDLFGAFNTSRANRVLYHIEEGNDATITPAFVEQLKNYITDSYSSIQMKGRDTNSMMKNYNHFIISSNENVPFKIHPQERRFFAVAASGEKVRDYAYFHHLAEIVLKDTKVVKEFYEFLSNRNIEGRDWCNPPNTDIMREWKYACESDLTQFVEYIRQGDQKEFGASDLYNAYREWCRSYGFTPISVRKFGLDIIKVTGIERHRLRERNSYTFKES